MEAGRFTATGKVIIDPVSFAGTRRAAVVKHELLLAFGQFRIKTAERFVQRAALSSEMQPIHSAKCLYWGRGEAVTLEARAEYQHRQSIRFGRNWLNYVLRR